MAKLPSGMRRRADGIYEKRFQINGERYSVYASTRKETERKEQELRKQIESGLYNANSNLTMDEYFTEWTHEKEKEVKSSSMRIYINQYVKHISPAIGKRKIKDIEKREVKKLLDNIPKTLSVETYNSILRTLKLILHDAVRDEVIMRSPAEGIKQRKRIKKATETYHRALTEQEQADFMQEIKDDFYYEFLALLLCTGMRWGEAACLEWGDIDRVNNVIHITKTATTGTDGKTIVGDSPKSESGRRDIPLTETTKAILKSQKQKMQLLNGSDVIIFTNRVFSTTRGNMPSCYAVNMSIKKALARLDEKGNHIDFFTCHCLRDTFATRFIEQGGNPQTLKTILGHSSLAMTMDLYSHVLPNTKQKEMDNLKIVL
jgi:integrase